MTSKRPWVLLSGLGVGAGILLVCAGLGFRRQTSTADARATSPRKVAQTSASSESLEAASGEEGKRVGSGPGASPPPARPAGGSSTEEPVEGKSRAPKAHADIYRARILDERLPPAVRVRDLHSLHQAGGITPAIAESMLKLLGESRDETVREGVFLGLEGTVSPEFKAAAIRSLESDMAPRVRKAAASALFPMKSDPSVKALLEAAAQKDPDRDVRRESERTLTRTENPKRWPDPKQGKP